MTIDEKKQRTKDTLSRAIELIEAGWIKGTTKYAHHSGQTCYCLTCYCLMGAIAEASGGIKGDIHCPESLELYDDAARCVYHELERRGHLRGYMTMYNDDPERTKEEVIGLLKDSIALV